MSTIIGSFLVMAAIVFIMSIGVIVGRKPVRGSCGGLNQIDGMNDCEICGGDTNKCENSSETGAS